MALGLVGLGLGVVGGLMNAFTSRKVPKLPPPVLEQFYKLPPVPDSPVRDSMIQDFRTNALQTSAQYLDSLPKVNGSIDTYANQLNDISGELTATQNALTTQSSQNPYLDYYSNPSATEAKDRAILQDQISSAFNPYGQQGSEFQNNLAAMSSNAAARGIYGSGIYKKAEREAELKQQATKQTAQATGEQQIQKNMIDRANLFNQGKQLANQALSKAGDLAYQKGDLLGKIPTLRQSAATNLGALNSTYGLNSSNLETEGRKEQITNDQYNTTSQQALANRNVNRQNNSQNAQWQTDAAVALNRPSVGDVISNLGGAIAGIGGR